MHLFLYSHLTELGFIGADTFQFVYAGCLLALNTFGGEMCMMVTVLAVVRGLGLGKGPGLGPGLAQRVEPGNEDQELERENPIGYLGIARRKQGKDLTGPVKSDLTASALAHWCGYRLWLLAATAGASTLSYHPPQPCP